MQEESEVDIMFEGMNGSFGAEIPRVRAENDPPRNGAFHSFAPRLEMSLERRVDIIAAIVIGIPLLMAIIFWDAFSDALFYQFLYPLLSTGGKVILIILGIVLAVMYIRFRIRCRFGRWF